MATALTFTIHPEGEHVPNFVAAETAEESYLNAAGCSWFEGHPPWLGLESQQPWNDGEIKVHHCPPLGQSTYGQYDASFELASGPQAVPIPAGRRSLEGQPTPLHGSLIQQPRKVGD